VTPRRNLLLLLLGAWAVSPLAAPAAPPPDEQWLSQAVLDELRQAPPDGWEALGRRVDSLILSRLSCGRLDRLGALTDLLYARRACRYLPLAAGAAPGGKLAPWLLDHRDLARRLFRALEDVRDPCQAMGRLAKLHAAGPERLADWPDLAVAFATAEEMKHFRPQPDPPDVAECFAYYTDPRNGFRCDVGKLPYELARYLADTRLSLAERRWAQATYGRAKDIDATFFGIEYDEDHFRQGKPKRNASAAYTLGNLSRLGGVCVDQAYFASEVCKALGIPAAIVFGRGGAGVEHAWFARYVPDRRGGQWISRTGRYQEHLYYVGVLRDPGSGAMILDSELMLLGTEALLPLEQREEADTATALARFVDGARDGNSAPDASLLARLAEQCRASTDAARRPRVWTGWLSAQRKIDLSMVEDLLEQAIRRDAAHVAAWRLLVDLRKADRLPVEHLGRFFDVLVRLTAAQYPEFSCQLVLKLVPTMPQADARQRAWRRAIEVYGKRPDLRGRLLVALGDDWRAAGQKDKALAAYRDAAVGTVQLAEIVVLAAGRAEQLYLEAGRRDLAIQLYAALFAKTEPQDVAEVFRAQTSHFQLGSRLAELLKADGKLAAAADIRRKLNG